MEGKISSISSERSALQIQVAKTSSQSELSTEQFKNLESNFKNLQNEYTDLKKRADSLQDLLSSQDARNRQVSEEASLSKSQVESLQNELANHRAEKRLAESIQNNLKTRIQELEENERKLTPSSRITRLLLLNSHRQLLKLNNVSMVRLLPYRKKPIQLKRSLRLLKRVQEPDASQGYSI